MNVTPINSFNRVQRPSFNASLYVQPGTRTKTDDSDWHFDMVMDEFKKKLADDPLHPEDVVVVSPIKHKSQVKTSYGAADANLKIAIDNYSSAFLYNQYMPYSRIAEDLYNTYKHVRYLRHYA